MGRAKKRGRRQGLRFLPSGCLPPSSTSGRTSPRRGNRRANRLLHEKKDFGPLARRYPRSAGARAAPFRARSRDSESSCRSSATTSTPLDAFPACTRHPSASGTPSRSGQEVDERKKVDGPRYLRSQRRRRTARATPVLVRHPGRPRAASGATESEWRSMLVAPGVPRRTPATMMTRCPTWENPSFQASPAGALHHVVEIVGVLGHDAMYAPISANKRRSGRQPSGEKENRHDG